MNRRLPLYIAIALVSLSAVAGAVFFFLSSRRPKPVEEVPTAPPEETIVRGPNWERRVNPDGSVSQTIFSTPTNYQTPEGSFEPIDTTLSSTASGGFENTTNTLKSFFDANVKSLALYNGAVTINSSFVDNELGTVNRVAPTEVKDNQITYKEVYPGVGVRYTILPGGVLEEFVLTGASRGVAATLPSLTQELILSSGKLEKRADGSIGIFSDNGQLLGFLPLPYMYEDEDQSQFSEGLSYELLHLAGEEGRRYRLSKVLSEKGKVWLADPQRKFPVVIDATVYQGQAKDGFLYRWCSGGTYAECRNSPINTQTSMTAFYVGQKWDAAWNEWWIQRGYVSFDTSSIPDDATIDSADLFLTLRHDTSDPDFDIKFYSGDWGDLDAADWNTGTVYEGVFRNTSGLSPGSTYNHSVNPASIDKLGETQFRLTSSREEAGNEPSGLEDVSFYSANYWNDNFRPRLEVTFTGVNNPPNTPSDPSPASGSTNQSLWTGLSWSGGDPDAGDTAVYDVYLKAGDSNFGAPVSANQAATTYDPGTLAYGTTYYWKIVARDGFGETATSPVWNFSTLPAPSDQTFLGNPADGSLDKMAAGGPFASCQEQMDAIKAQTPTVETISSDHEVGFYSANCENVGWMSRMFISFDTSSIPDGDTIYSATLYLTLYDNIGTPPYTPPVVDFGVYSGGSDPNYQECYGTLSDPSNPQDWLDPSDWDACGTYEGNIIENMAGMPGVSGTVYALPIHPENISKNGLTQFRIIRQFPPEDYLDPDLNPTTNSFDSYVNFYSADSFPSRRPRLVIDTSSTATGTISGFVWEDTGGGPNAGNGLKDAGEDFYVDQSVEISCVSSGPSGYSQTHNTDTLNDGRYVCDNVPAGEEITVSLNPNSLPSGLYPSKTMLDGGVCFNGGIGFCRIALGAGDTHEVSLGIWDNPSSGWLQVKNGDVYAGLGITISIPDAPDPSYERWFTDAVPDDQGGGVAISGTSISAGSGDWISQRPNNVAPGWHLKNYSGPSWPSVLDSIDRDDGVVDYEIDFTIDTDAEATAFTGKVLVAENNITIGGGVSQINAVLIAKNQIVINGSGNNTTLTIKGAMFAKNGFGLAKTLNNNKKPAIVVEYDPAYLLQAVPGLIQSGVSWKEVK